MKRKILISLILVIVSIAMHAQEKKDTTYWTKGGNYSINFTQVSFSNWASGGINAVSGVTALKLFANYNEANTSWENKLDLGYGLAKQDTFAVQKSNDIMAFQSKLGIKSTNQWFYSAMLNYESQFTPGYSDASKTKKISNLFSPAYINLSLGMDYKPSKKFSMMLSPLTGKMTIVTDEDLRKAYGVDTTKSYRMEMGAYLNSTLAFEILKNVNLTTDLALFSNYLKNPQNIDVNWKLELNFKINEYLTAKINTHLIYDDDIKTPSRTIPNHMSPQVQFKELIGIGLSLKF